MPGDRNELFPLQEGLDPLAGGFGEGQAHAISPVLNHCVSEFALQYMGLFLLSSLVRYRPQIWMHAISHSIVPGELADDKALSLVERFLNLNRCAVPEMVIKVLNPHEDYSFG